MPTFSSPNSKYIFLDGDNFIDMDLAFPTVSLEGQSVQIVGTGDIDRVFVRPGTSVDFVQSGGGADKLYLEGQLSDYAVALNGTVLSLTRGAGATAESALVNGNGTDVIVFGDGTVAASALRDYVQSQASPALPAVALPVPSGETSIAPALPASYTSTAKFVAFSATTFAPVHPGIDVTLVGSGDVDTVYVDAGSSVNAVNLGGSQDLIYFTGTWADYTKTTAGTELIFERDIDGYHERVLVSQGNSAATSDKLIFADGAVSTYVAGAAIHGGVDNGIPIAGLSSLAGYDPLTFTPGTGPHLPVLALAASGDPFVNANDGGVQVSVSYGNMRSGDVIQLVDVGVRGGAGGTAGASVVGVAHTVSDGEAAAGAVSLYVAKASLGVADGVKYLVANITGIAGSASSSELDITLDTSIPLAPTVTPAHAALDAASATDPSGAITVIAEAGSSVEVVFTAGSHTVTQTVAGTGAAQPVSLTTADLATLGDGTVAVQVVVTDAAGNASLAGGSSFILDTVAPAVPVLSAAASLLDAASAAAGAVSVQGEAGSTFNVTFSNVIGGTVVSSITKTIVATGAVQSVSLDASDLLALSDGSVRVSAYSTDAAGNASAASTTSFTLDTVAPAAPLVAVVAGDDIVNASEQSAGVLLHGTAEPGTTVTLHLTGSSNASTPVTVQALVVGGDWSYQLLPSDLASLGQGAATLSAVSTDPAGNATASAGHVLTIDTVAPAITSIDRGTTALVDASGNTSSNGSLDFVVTFDDASVVGASLLSNWVAKLNGVVLAGAVTGVQATSMGSFVVTVNAAQVGQADGSLTIALADSNTVADTAGNAASLGSASITQAYVIDHVDQSPVFAAATRTVSVAENSPVSTVLLSGGATDPDLTAPNNTLSYSVAGTDADLFNIDTASGAVAFRSSPDFETVAHGGHLQFTLVATDGAGRSALQSVSVDVQDVNEAPVVGTVIHDQFAAVGSAFSFAVPAGAFTDPDSVASGGDHTLSYSAMLAGGAALPTWLHFDAATATFTGVAPSAGHIDVTVTATDGGAVPLSASQTFDIESAAAVTLTTSLAGVSNFDVTSPIVLNAGEAVTPVAGKYIHLIDLGGTLGGVGFDGENTVHTQDILVTDSHQVQVVGNNIVLDPSFNLDLSSNYALSVDDGAFTSSASHMPTAAVDAATVHFGTVTPGGGSGSAVASAAASQSMDAATGALVASYSWWNIEGVGNTASKVDADLSSGKIAMVFKDWNVAGGNAAAGEDGIGVNHAFWVNATKFGADDMLYIDDQTNSPAQVNMLAWTDVNNNGSQPVRLAFDPAPGIGTEGQAWVDVSLANTTAAFASISEMQTLLTGAQHQAVVSG